VGQAALGRGMYYAQTDQDVFGRTVAEYAGVEGLRDAELPSLASMIRGDVAQGPQVSFSDFLDDRRVIRAGRYKLILRGLNITLFDLERDPDEQHELSISDRPIAGRFLRVMLGQYLGSVDRGHWTSSDQHARQGLRREAAQIDAQTCAQLRAIGYVVDCGATTVGQTD
jgi:hypothetical protein